jgi:hypothetical protein
VLAHIAQKSLSATRRRQSAAAVIADGIGTWIWVAADCWRLRCCRLCRSSRLFFRTSDADASCALRPPRDTLGLLDSPVKNICKREGAERCADDHARRRDSWPPEGPDLTLTSVQQSIRDVSWLCSRIVRSLLWNCRLACSTNKREGSRPVTDESLSHRPDASLLGSARPTREGTHIYSRLKTTLDKPFCSL